MKQKKSRRFASNIDDRGRLNPAAGAIVIEATAIGWSFGWRLLRIPVL